MSVESAQILDLIPTTTAQLVHDNYGFDVGAKTYVSPTRRNLCNCNQCFELRDDGEKTPARLLYCKSALAHRRKCACEDRPCESVSQTLRSAPGGLSLGGGGHCLREAVWRAWPGLSGQFPNNPAGKRAHSTKFMLGACPIRAPPACTRHSRPTWQGAGSLRAHTDSTGTVRMANPA
jgi:hypothetical protein